MTENELALLEEQCERLEEKLYHSRHNGTHELERMLIENEWNRLRRIQAEKLGKKWTDRHDRRDSFNFHISENRFGTITVTVTAPLFNPDKTINWRKTKVGKQVERKLHSGVSYGTGDDAGHLISVEFGPDPGEPLNIALQNWDMNRRGPGWKGAEDAVKTFSRTSQEGHRIIVTSQTPKGAERENCRTMTVLDADLNVLTLRTVPGKEGGPLVLDNYTAGNFSTEKYREKLKDREVKNRSQELAKEMRTRARTVQNEASAKRAKLIREIVNDDAVDASSRERAESAKQKALEEMLRKREERERYIAWLQDAWKDQYLEFGEHWDPSVNLDDDDQRVAFQNEQSGYKPVNYEAATPSQPLNWTSENTNSSPYSPPQQSNQIDPYQYGSAQHQHTQNNTPSYQEVNTTPPPKPPEPSPQHRSVTYYWASALKGNNQ